MIILHFSPNDRTCVNFFHTYHHILSMGNRTSMLGNGSAFGATGYITENPISESQALNLISKGQQQQIKDHITREEKRLRHLKNLLKLDNPNTSQSAMMGTQSMGMADPYSGMSIDPYMASTQQYGGKKRSPSKKSKSNRNPKISASRKSTTVSHKKHTKKH